MVFGLAGEGPAVRLAQYGHQAEPFGGRIQPADYEPTVEHVGLAAVALDPRLLDDDAVFAVRLGGRVLRQRVQPYRTLAKIRDATRARLLVIAARAKGFRSESGRRAGHYDFDHREFPLTVPLWSASLGVRPTC